MGEDDGVKLTEPVDRQQWTAKSKGLRCQLSAVDSRRSFIWMVLIAAGLCLVPNNLRAGTTGKRAATRNSGPNSGLTAKHRGRRKSGLKSNRVKTGRGSRRARKRRRLAALHLEPQRIEEIQRALISTGKLREEPTGRWDDQTREAMRRYQKANGFTLTGLPDAKSLMKLGLGPHPLPPDVDSSGAARASLDPSQEHSTPEEKPKEPPQ